MPRTRRAYRSDAFDPTETLAAKIAVMHNAAFPATAWCNPRDQGSAHETARVYQALVVSHRRALQAAKLNVWRRPRAGADLRLISP
jgi:hypothetical protein